MAKVNLSFDEERTNLLREEMEDNKEAIEQSYKKLLNTLDGAPIGVSIAALFLTITTVVRAYFDNPKIPNRIDAMDHVGWDLIQLIHILLLKKF